MNEQLSHHTISFKERKFPIILLADNITGEANLGSLFRIADAFGVAKIIFCGSRPNLESNRLKRTARNTQNSVEFDFHESTLKILKVLKKKKFKTMGLEITSHSSEIQKFRYHRDENILLIAGNERNGVSSEVLKYCDEIYHIEMFGKNSSMNVAQSVGIALYEITKAMLKFNKK